MNTIIFSTSPAYFEYAERELVHVLEDTAVTRRLGPDCGSIETLASISDVASLCRDRPVVFVRHLFQAIDCLSTAVADDRLASAVEQVVARSQLPRAVSLQVWSSAWGRTSARTDVSRAAIVHALHAAGFDVSRGGREHTVSVCRTDDGIILGVNTRHDSLSDWPGGRVSMKKSAAQISRAEFKLEEALNSFDVSLPEGGYVLDLGASPGGWTRILRLRGLHVVAVDPASLDPRIAKVTNVVHVQQTAGRFLAGNKRVFDVAVNDMRMTPQQSCAVMIKVSRHLRPGGIVIMTIKLGRDRPLRTVEACLGQIREVYELLHARQLYHNRNEVTVVARRRAQQTS